jgi:hypothetical protein
MRSSAPVPDNPWPHDMLVEIQDDPWPLIELLWIREAYRLRPSGDDTPPLLEYAPPLAAAPVPESTRQSWEDGWTSMWDDVVGHAGLPRDQGDVDALGATANGSTERRDLLRRIVGPDWRERFGDEAFADPSYAEWTHALQRRARESTRSLSLDEQPERRALTALVPAWRAGLVKIVTVPCEGEYSRRLGPHCLLVTAQTRSSTTAYARALEGWTIG